MMFHEKGIPLAVETWFDVTPFLMQETLQMSLVISRQKKDVERRLRSFVLQ
jgi:hypothetical protein